MARWIRFILAMLIGVGLGMLYGWEINPVKYVDTTPDSLGIEYKTDYVLMVAEAYHAEGKLDVAVRRLALLGDAPPLEIVHQAVLFAEREGYLDADLALMRALSADLQLWNTEQEAPAP